MLENGTVGILLPQRFVGSYFEFHFQESEDIKSLRTLVRLPVSD
jgi:hypothetical protein